MRSNGCSPAGPTRRHVAALARAVALVAAAVLAAVFAAPAARAQGRARVRGSVFQPDSATPASGVVVALVDTSGAEVARALTDGSGAFSIATSPGRYSARALKVGFHPTSTPPFEVVDDAVRELRIVLAGDAVQLDAVRVEGESSCRIRDDSARVVATLWDQARAALAASTLTSGESYRSVLVRYRNLVPVGTRRVIDEAVSIVQSTGANGFVSLNADTLAREGFIVTAGRRAEFRAPDAGVLLSPSFAVGHCFRVVPPPAAHPEWVGVAFTPVRDRRGFADIRGSFWLDRVSSELRKLEYTYLNVPSTMMRDDAQGWVEFAELPTGEWIVSQWAIRTPVTDPGSRPMPGMPDTLLAMATAGGITRAVLRDSAVLYENYRGAVTFHLVAGDSTNPTRGARGTIVSTDRAGSVDSSSTITFTNIPPGRYTFRFRTPLMQWIGAPPTDVDYDVADSTDATRSLQMPTTAEILYRTCGLTHVVHGYVVGDSGQGVPFAEVQLEGTAMEAERIGSASILRPVPFRRVVRADTNGRWHACVATGPISAAARVKSALGIKAEGVVPPGVGLIRLDLPAPGEKRP